METKKRSFLKAISWRVAASVITGSLVFLFTQQGLLAFSVGIADSLVKIVMYFLHERLWAGISYGLLKHPLHRIEVVKPLKVEHEQIIRQKLDEMGYLPD